MDHASPKTIAPATVTPELSKWLLPAVINWLGIAACFAVAQWALFDSPSWWIAAPTLFLTLVVLASRQHALGILGHDGAHKLACRNRFVNDSLTSLLCFWPMGANLGGYRRFHFGHHRNSGTADDPEHIHTRSTFKIFGIPILGQWQAPIERWKFASLLAFDFLGGAIPHMSMAIYLTRPEHLIDKIAPLLTLGTIATILYSCNSLWMLGFWFLSIWTAFWAIFRLRIWTEHVNTSGTHLIKGNAWQRFLFLPHNTEYHFEHHQHPSVPFWALPRFRATPEKAITVAELFAQHFSQPADPATPRPATPEHATPRAR